MFGASMRLPRLVFLGLLSLTLSTAVASAQYCTPDQCDECNLCRCSQRCCHELPELWLINTRCAPRCRNLDNGFNCLIFKRYDRRCCRWVRESLESFLAQESSLPSLFYVHGNSLNHKNAMKSCWKIYCKMRCCPGPKRLVFWSWPAERVYKTEGLRVREMIRKNLRIKYVYAEYQGYYLAKLVQQMSLSQRVMLSGHSYGAITAAAALHWMGGGCLRGLTLEGGVPVERPNLRAAMISGAFDHDMLNPGNRYGQTFVSGEKVFVTRNIKDRTLKKWPKTSWRCKKAIGVLGVNANCLGEYRNKLCQQTMTDDVGTSHYLKPHLKSVKFVAALCCLSFPQCNTCQPSSCQPSCGPTLSCPPLTDVDFKDEQEVTIEVVSDEQLLAEAQFVLDDGLELATYDRAAELAELSLLADINLPPSASAVGYDDDPIYDEASLDALVNSTPPQAQPDVIAEEPAFARTESTQPTAQLRTTEASGNYGLMYRVGLCLTLVLTGQFYILFSKRIASS